MTYAQLDSSLTDLGLFFVLSASILLFYLVIQKMVSLIIKY